MTKFSINIIFRMSMPAIKECKSIMHPSATVAGAPKETKRLQFHFLKKNCRAPKILAAVISPSCACVGGGYRKNLMRVLTFKKL